LLNDARSDGDVVEETKAHMLIRFSVMPWRSYDRETLLHFASGDR
jgi:hypothetical protein